MRIAVITSCAVTRTVTPIVKVSELGQGTMKDLVSEWWSDLQAIGDDKKVTPGDLYRGPSMDIVFKIAQMVGHENVFIVTGGQGLVSLDTPIVPYDFTSDKKAEHNIHQHVTGEPFSWTTWWGLINSERHGIVNPIAERLIEHFGYDYVLAALPKGFIKYIVDDIASIPTEHRHKMIVPIPRSNRTSFPQRVRDMMLLYSQSFVEGASQYSRAQNAALRILSDAQASSMSVTVATIAEEEEVAEQRGDTSTIDYDAMFSTHPELLQAPDGKSAIRMAKALGYKIGGRHRFVGAWMGARGHAEVDKKDIPPQAVEALSTILKESKTPQASEDAIVKELAIFVALLKEHAYDRLFASADVVAWAALTFGEQHDSGILSTAKVNYYLDFYAKYLGIQKLGTMYKIIDTTAQ